MNVTDDLNIVTYAIKEFFILACSIYIFMRMVNADKIKYVLLTFIFLIPVSIITFFISRNYSTFYCFIFQAITLIILNKINFTRSVRSTIINTIITLGTSYLLLVISIILTAIPTIIFQIQNDYIFLVIMLTIFIFIVWKIFMHKKIKNGIVFLKSKLENEKYDLLLLNISVVFLYLVMIIPKSKLAQNPAIVTVLFAIIMIITIKKSLDAYYKQTLLIQDLKDTKIKLEEKTKEVEELEKENLEIGKKSHSLAHKQKILENKLNEVICNSEIGAELTLNDEMKKLSKEIYGNKKQPELSKTDISLVDDVLRCMQKECIDKNIDFELQITGNIHYMINHYINEEELQILIADHVKDAIIAIEHSDNINRSILVKIGELDGNFGLYIYDSGIEFEKEVLDNLGKQPITTHKDSGGTGMGFMNTFDTLKKHNASLIIKEIGPVSETEYTKAIMIKLDDKGEFKIDTYK